MKIMAVFSLLVLTLLLPAQTPNDASKTRLLIAFASFRDRPRHPQVYFYEHDGVAQGKLLGAIDPVNQRSDYHPALSGDGRLCAFSAEAENQTSRIFLWSLADRKLITLSSINDAPNAQLHPSLDGPGRRIAFTAWDKAGSSTRWDVQLYDVAAQKFHEKPRFNLQAADERMPALSGDGRYLAYCTNVRDGAGRTDIALFDLEKQEAIALPGLNSPSMDVTPSMSHDGRWLAFASDRPGGLGGRDIYLYDRKDARLVPLPGLNSVANEQTPWLSGDGRFVAFVSERFPGEGERDIYVFDRRTQKLVPTPGLNSKREDFDPCVIELK